MNTFKSATILIASALVGVDAQRYTQTYGFGPGPEIYTLANQNPLNRTNVNFPGFDFNADPGSTANATTGSWTWHAGLSIINRDTNETNYPLSAATNQTENVINVAYTLDFPGGQLPQQNYTNWTICANAVDIPWTSAVRQRASNDPGDCSVVLGEACLNKVHNGWRGSSTSGIGCTSGPDITSYAECSSISTNGYGYYSSSIMSFLSDPNNRSSTEVGLKAGQIFSYEAGATFDASQAQANYNENASKLRMMVLTFAPSKAFASNHSGVLNPGEVRTFCSILNKKAPVTNAASRSSTFHKAGATVAVWILLVAWEMF